MKISLNTLPVVESCLYLDVRLRGLRYLSKCPLCLKRMKALESS